MRNKKILIISLIAVLVLVCITFTILFFATDIFKGGLNKENFKKNKEKFKEYLAEMEIKKLVDLEAVNTDIQKKAEEKYKTEGSISVNVNLNEEPIIDEIIEFNTKSDPENKKDSSEINIKIDGEETLKVNYLRNENIFGILFSNIVNQYIVLENNNLQKVASNLYSVTPAIPNKIEIPERILNVQEFNEIFSKYINIMIEEIPENNFTKANSEQISSLAQEGEKIKKEAYVLKINKEILSIMLEKLVNTIKEDEKVLDLIKETTGKNISSEEYRELIDKYYNKISLEDFDEEFELIVYNEEEMKRIELRIKDNLSISLEKRDEDIALIANVSSEKEGNMFFTIVKNKEGQVSINLSIAKDEETFNVSVIFKFNTVFDSEIEIEELKEGDYLLLNDLSKKQTQNLITNLGKKIVKETNIEEGIIGKVLETFSTGILGAGQQVKEESEETVENNLDDISNQATEMFNASLQVYEGKQRGTSVKGLISSIKSKNSMESEHTIDCDYGIEDIESSKTYNISFKKDSEGYINKVIIEEQ